jgi:hypothetical protein
METRNSGLLIHIRTKSTHPLGFTNVDGKVKLRRMKMNQINNSKKIYHAAIYVRLSKEDGDVATAGKRESNSISNQKNLIKNFLKDKKDIEVYEKLLNILPNDTILFEKEHDQANQRGKEMNISVDPIFMQEYISEHYPKLI